MPWHIGRNNEWLPRIEQWVRDDGLTRAECSRRLAEWGLAKEHRAALCRFANEVYAFGWDVRTQTAMRAEIAEAQAYIGELHRQGYSRADTQRLVAERYKRSPSTVSTWMRGMYTVKRKPSPRNDDAPADAVNLAASIEAALRADGYADAAACPVEYDTDVEVWRWGVAVVYGDPARIILARDAADWQRQYPHAATNAA